MIAIMWNHSQIIHLRAYQMLLLLKRKPWNTHSAVLVDVRKVAEFRSSHIPGMINQLLSSSSQIEIHIL